MLLSVYFASAQPTELREPPWSISKLTLFFIQNKVHTLKAATNKRVIYLCNMAKSHILLMKWDHVANQENRDSWAGSVVRSLHSDGDWTVRELIKSLLVVCSLVDLFLTTLLSLWESKQ